MIFSKKSEKKRRFPLSVGVTIGALAVIGAMSIKNKGCAVVSGTVSKMKSVFKKKPVESVFADCECEF